MLRCLGLTTYSGLENIRMGVAFLGNSVLVSFRGKPEKRSFYCGVVGKSALLSDLAPKKACPSGSTCTIISMLWNPEGTPQKGLRFSFGFPSDDQLSKAYRKTSN